MGEGELDEGSQKVQTSGYKINKSWGCNVYTAWCLQLIILYYIFESCYKNKSFSKFKEDEEFTAAI